MADPSQHGIPPSEKLMKFAQILYKCTLCTTLPSILTSKDTFLSHMRDLHLSSSENLSACAACKIGFGTKEDLETHINVAHRNGDVRNSEHEDENGRHDRNSDEAEDRNEENLYRCPYCEWTSSLEVIMRAHLRRYHDSDEDISLVKNHDHSKTNSGNFNFNNDSNISIIIAHNEEWFHCKLCDIKAKRDSLQEHCSGEQHQSKVFSLQGDFISHEDDETGNEIQNIQEEFGEFTCTMNLDNMTFYYCQLCSFKTKLILTFRNHVKSVDHKLKLQSISGYEMPCSGGGGGGGNGNSGNFGNEMNHCDTITTPSSGGSCSRRKRLYPAASFQRPSLGSDDAPHSEQSDYENEVATSKREKRDSSLNHSQSEANGSEINKFSVNNSVTNLQDIIRRIPFQNAYNSSKQEFSKTACFPSINTVTEDPYQKIASKWDLEPKQKDVSMNKSTQHDTKQSNSDNHQANNEQANTCDTVNQSAKLPETAQISNPELQKNPASNLDYSMESMWKFLQELEQGVAKCPHCQQGLRDYEDYCSHVNEVHGFPDANSPKETVQESFKMRKIRQELEGVICECRTGVVGRDELLQTLSMKCDVDLAELMTWGPACNKAVRDLFPDSVAQRKGKYKKTYFFGVKFLVAPQIPSRHETEDEALSNLSPLRDISKDTEEILKYLHRIMTWTGRTPDFVTRDIILEILSTLISDPDVPNWGIQCNRAIRQTFPHVAIKRKWKFKTYPLDTGMRFFTAL